MRCEKCGGFGFYDGECKDCGYEEKKPTDKVVRNVLIQVGEFFVCGYSKKRSTVLKTYFPDGAKRFTAVESQEFLSEHCNKSRGIEYAKVKIHVIKGNDLTGIRDRNSYPVGNGSIRVVVPLEIFTNCDCCGQIIREGYDVWQKKELGSTFVHGEPITCSTRCFAKFYGGKKSSQDAK